MHIGDDTNFLRIEGCRIEASASAGGRSFTAVHEAVLIDGSDETKRNFADFADFKSSETQVKLTEDGWIQICRSRTGALAISYRIAGWKAEAAMEGKVYIEGEFVNSFCAEFRSLLHRWGNFT